MTESFRPEQNLDQRLFTAGVRSVSMLMRERGARPLTLGEDLQDFGICDGLEKIDGMTDETIVGRTALIEGKIDGVSYGLHFTMYDEISSPYPDMRIPMLDLRVYATSGDEYYPKNEAEILEDPRAGALRGLIWWQTDKTIWADFGHGTTSSSDPTTQRVLNKVVGYYGLGETEVFSEHGGQGVVYDNEHLKELINGMQALTQSPEL